MSEIKKKYKQKLILSFACLNLFCVLLSSVGFYALSMGNLKKNYASVVQSTLAETQKNINQKIEYNEFLAKNYLMDQVFYAYMQKEYSRYEGTQVLNNNLLPKGREMISLSKNNVLITLYIENQTIPEYFYHDTDKSTERSFSVRHIDAIREKPYYQRYRTGSGYLWWEQIDDDKERGRISLISRAGYVFGGKDVGLLVIKMSVEDMIVQSMSVTDDQLYYEIRTGEDQFITSNFSEEDGIRTEFDKECTETTLENGWKIRLYMPLENISEGQSQILLVILLLSLGTFLVNVLLGRIISEKLYSSMNSILIGISRFQRGEYDYEIKVSKNDEFSEIADALNNLAKEVQHLIDDVYENMLQKQNIEYQMLRAKINPHFLSNIFNLIVQLAEGKEYDKIVLAAQQTANFYRKNLARNKDSVKLMEEMNAILAYLDIIGLMKPGAVTCHYEVDAKTERCIIPSFLLQPIVENAVNHAMVNGKITLCISAKAEKGNLTIKIRDNGIGMSREQMENLFKIRGSHGYGLYSIRERIRLKYPDAQYGVFASCEEGCGTEISIVIPEVNEFEQEEADV